MTANQFIDLEVTRAKYTEELQNYLGLKSDYRKEGVYLIEEEFPNLYFLFAAPKLQPVPIAFAVRINFENYDAAPLSVAFVHPITLVPLQVQALSTRLPRKIIKADGSFEFQFLVQADLDNRPFLCLPGIREYHEHPAHTGDSWFLLRGRKGDGTLLFILDKLVEYGVSGLQAYHSTLNLELNVPAMQLKYDQNTVPI